MAHELSTNEAGQVEAMFATHVKPWHGLGEMVDGAQTPRTALTLAHLDWLVRKVPLTLPNGAVVPDKMATIRADSEKYLGTVGTDWTPVQNVEQAEFIEALVGTGHAVVECVGALKEGRRTFWTCKLPGNLIVTPGDEIERYMILANGHDGGMAFRAFWSPIRVVCQNTLNAALSVGRVQEGVTLYHTKNVKSRVEQAKRILGVAGTYYDRLGETFHRMIQREITGDEFKLYVDEVFPLPKEEGKKAGVTTQRAREAVTKNMRSGVGAKLAGHTAWGAYNAVTEYIDHQKSQKSAGDEEQREKRFESILTGTGKALQQKAFDTALALVS
ncbi:MAG: DUF932 domain-containing protein [Planctomycetota bacterium]|nr:DUF932 domain-containing protein [Planctomycetota bacterium]